MKQSSLASIAARHDLRIRMGRSVNRDKENKLKGAPIRGSVLTDQTQQQGGGPPSGETPDSYRWVAEA